MADIKNYLKEKAKREQRQQRQADYEEKIARYKQRNLYWILAAVAVCVAVAVVVVVQYSRHIYTGYDIISSVERESIQGTTDVKIGTAILSYSKDGAHCTDAMGNVGWNQTFEIQNAKMAFSGETVAIGDYNGRSIYLANQEKFLGEITTTMPIRDVAVSEAGYVTAVLADTDLTWINTYDFNGKHLFQGQARMNDSGYPVDIGMSPGGELLCVSYIYVDAGVLKSNIGFYNFHSVGSERSDFLVSAYTYTDMLIPFVQFMNDQTAFAVGDGMLIIYSGAHVPVVQEGHNFSKEIQSVFYSDRYIGLVFFSDNNENRYQIEIYEPAASKKRTFYFDMEYTDIFFGKNNFVIYNDTECQIMTMDGIEKYHGAFSKNVRLMLPVGNTYKYLLVTDNSIDTIQLK